MFRRLQAAPAPPAGPAGDHVDLRAFRRVDGRADCVLPLEEARWGRGVPHALQLALQAGLQGTQPGPAAKGKDNSSLGLARVHHESF